MLERSDFIRVHDREQSFVSLFEIFWGCCRVRRKRLNPAYGDNTGYGSGNKVLAKLNQAHKEQNLLKQGRLG